jgi:tetratricopeptide (TPR) repeat protein
MFWSLLVSYTSAIAQWKERIREAEEHLKSGRLTLAVSLLDEVVKADTENIQALTLLGRAYLSVKQVSEAERFFQRALNEESGSPEANLGMGIVLLLKGEAAKAIMHATIALDDDSTRLDGLKVMGQIAAEQGNLNRAREIFDQVLSIDSTSYDALANLGTLYQQAGNHEKSLSYFQQAVRFHPVLASAWHNIGLSYAVNGQFHDAIIALNRAATLDSVDSRSVRTLGILYVQQGLHGEALATFQRALERDFLDIESRVGKASAYWSLKEYHSALKEIDDIRTMGVRFNRMELFLADIYFKKKDYEQAVEYAAQDEEMNPSQVEGHYLLGLLYRLRGDHTKADNEFEEASSITRQNPQVPLVFSVNTLLAGRAK